MASVIYESHEREGLSDEDMALLHEHVLNHIQTSPDIRRIISQNREAFVGIHPDIRGILRSKANALLERLNQQRQPAGSGGRKTKGRGTAQATGPKRASPR
jgi:hypothetical protein